MKGLNKTVIAIAIATLPFPAMAEFKALNDTTLGNVTGQAGVTINLQTQIKIDQIKYTDQGSLNINNIFIGGAGSVPKTYFGVNWGAGSYDGNNLNDIQINIDLKKNGDAYVNFLPANLGNAIDFKVTVGSVDLASADGLHTARLLSNLSIEGLGFGLSAVVSNANKNVHILADFAISNFSTDINLLAMGLKNVQITGANYNPQLPRLLDIPTTLDLTLGTRNNSLGVKSLAIDMGTFNADVSIGSLEIGGTSIGSVFIDNLAISNTSMIVYGH